MHAVEKKRRGVDYLETKTKQWDRPRERRKDSRPPKLLNKAIPSHNGVTSRPGNGSETP